MIDHERLCELVEDFGLDGLEEIVGIFLLEARESIEQLERADNQDEVLHHLHFLKGCSRNVGALQLGNFCETMEGADRMLPGSRYVSDLRTGLQETQTAIHAWTVRQAA